MDKGIKAHVKYSKTCVKRPLSKRQKTGFQDQCLMQVKSIAECNKGSIRQYFRPSFSYHSSLRSFCQLLSGHFTQVLVHQNLCDIKGDYKAQSTLFQNSGVVYDCVTWDVLYRYDNEEVDKNYRTLQGIRGAGEADEHRKVSLKYPL